MFKVLQRLFSKNQIRQQKNKASTTNHERSIEEYFRDEIENSPYFKPEFRQSVLDHLLHKKNLDKTGNNLTVEEKRSLGINTNLSITKELAQVLSSEGILLKNPKALLREIYYGASITKSRVDGFERARKLGIKKFKLGASGDGSECKWCRSNLGREFGVDILNQMRTNCRCTPYSKCVINAVIDFQ